MTDLNEVKAAAERIIGDEACLNLVNEDALYEHTTMLAHFAVLAAPVIEAAERLHDTVTHGARFQESSSVVSALVEIRTALAKLRG